MANAWSNKELTTVVICADDQIWIYNNHNWSPVSIGDEDSPLKMAYSIAQLWDLEPAPEHVRQMLVPGQLMTSCASS
jgi:hypothetical protein